MTQDSGAIILKIKETNNDRNYGTSLVNKGIEIYEQTLDYKFKNDISDDDVFEKQKLNSLKEYAKTLMLSGSKRSTVALFEKNMYCRILKDKNDQNAYDKYCDN